MGLKWLIKQIISRCFYGSALFNVGVTILTKGLLPLFVSWWLFLPPDDLCVCIPRWWNRWIMLAHKLPPLLLSGRVEHLEVFAFFRLLFSRQLLLLLVGLWLYLQRLLYLQFYFHPVLGVLFQKSVHPRWLLPPVLFTSEHHKICNRSIQTVQFLLCWLFEGLNPAERVERTIQN